MRRRTSRFLHCAALLLSLAAMLLAIRHSTQGFERFADEDVAALLDRFNRAASTADFDGYFSCLAPNGVFIGTDASERWTVEDLRAFMQPYFDQGLHRKHTPTARQINMLAGGSVAAFDETIELEGLGTCRGTGVAVKTDGRWLIAQYGLSIPVPNAIVFDVVEQIQRYDDADDDTPAAIRAVLDEYLATASRPVPGPVDPALFTPDVDALWSNGVTYRGRAAVVEATNESQLELTAFDSFTAVAEDVHINHRGNVAWLNCTLQLAGTLAADGAPFQRTVRSSFVFTKHIDRWQIAAEHSNRVE